MTLTPTPPVGPVTFNPRRSSAMRASSQKATGAGVSSDVEIVAPLPTAGPTSLSRRQALKARYPIMAAALVLLIGLGLGSSDPLSWLLVMVAGLCLAGLTVNALLPDAKASGSD